MADPPPARAAPAGCRICGGESFDAGSVHGSYSGRDYALRRCDDCGYAFIADPWLDFDQIYDARYYAGKGADPLIDYEFELEHPVETVRRYEWRGIANIVSGLLGHDRAAGAAWLDFGCGNGGLVRHLREQNGADAYGFDEGQIVERARERGLPILCRDELAASKGRFDAVTAIEVLEHTLDPLQELRTMRELLRPGGILFVTTGNAAVFSKKLARWRYVVPEIHISFFEPRTLATAMLRTGFAPEQLARRQRVDFDQIMKFKVLKTLRVRRRSALTDALPARLARLADRHLRLSDQPFGRAL